VHGRIWRITYNGDGSDKVAGARGHRGRARIGGAARGDASRRRPKHASVADASRRHSRSGGARQPDLSWRGERRHVQRMSRVGRRRQHGRARAQFRPLAVERRQPPGAHLDDREWRGASQAISGRHAAVGRGPAFAARSGRGGGIRLGHRPCGRALIAYPRRTRDNARESTIIARRLRRTLCRSLIAPREGRESLQESGRSEAIRRHGARTSPRSRPAGRSSRIVGCIYRAAARRPRRAGFNRENTVFFVPRNGTSTPARRGKRNRTWTSRTGRPGARSWAHLFSPPRRTPRSSCAPRMDTVAGAPRGTRSTTLFPRVTDPFPAVVRWPELRWHFT